jgi:hypothetical protein
MSRLTEAEVIAHAARHGLRLDPALAVPRQDGLATPTPLIPTGTPPRSLQQASPYRSKTEGRYAELLRWRAATGEIVGWLYEPLSLRLGADLHYRPDFLVWRTERPLVELVEVKGTWIRDRAMAKVKAAATRFPAFTFTLAVWDRQTWTETRIAAHGET